MSVGDGASSVPAGWYPDPADDARLRRWDGEKWTPDVILAPQQDPVGFIPPPSVPTPTEYAPPPPAAEPRSAPQAATQPPPFHSPPSSPGPASPLASSPPPTVSSPASAQYPSPRPTAAPTAEQPPSPPSGPVSLPEWATLPGLTLPPDLSGIPGLEPEPVLKAPTFEEPRKPGLRPPDWNSQPEFEQPTRTSRRAQQSTPTPAKNYAPPPAGVQYDVPPPPGAARVTGQGPVLPASTFAVPQAHSGARPFVQGPSSAGGVPPAVGVPPRIAAAPVDVAGTGGMLTPWAWLIALLPLIQFGVVYLVFGVLGSEFQPGMQWGILAAPAAFSLLFAIGDRRSLVKADVERAPSPLLAIVPPIYLLVRAVDVGRSSAITLAAWLVLQVAAAAGVYVLLPHLLALASGSAG